MRRLGATVLYAAALSLQSDDAVERLRTFMPADELEGAAGGSLEYQFA